MAMRLTGLLLRDKSNTKSRQGYVGTKVVIDTAQADSRHRKLHSSKPPAIPKGITDYDGAEFLLHGASMNDDAYWFIQIKNKQKWMNVPANVVYYVEPVTDSGLRKHEIWSNIVSKPPPPPKIEQLDGVHDYDYNAFGINENVGL